LLLALYSYDLLFFFAFIFNSYSLLPIMAFHILFLTFCSCFSYFFYSFSSSCSLFYSFILVSSLTPLLGTSPSPLCKSKNTQSITHLAIQASLPTLVSFFVFLFVFCFIYCLSFLVSFIVCLFVFSLYVSICVLCFCCLYAWLVHYQFFVCFLCARFLMQVTFVFSLAYYFIHCILHLHTFLHDDERNENWIIISTFHHVIYQCLHFDCIGFK
jgi:hypothetical protein